MVTQRSSSCFCTHWLGVPVSSIDDLNYVISLIHRCLFIPCQHPIGPIVDPGGRCGAKPEAEFKEVLVANYLLVVSSLPASRAHV